MSKDDDEIEHYGNVFVQIHWGIRRASHLEGHTPPELVEDYVKEAHENMFWSRSQWYKTVPHNDTSYTLRRSCPSETLGTTSQWFPYPDESKRLDQSPSSRLYGFRQEWGNQYKSRVLFGYVCTKNFEECADSTSSAHDVNERASERTHPGYRGNKRIHVYDGVYRFRNPWNCYSNLQNHIVLLQDKWKTS